MYVPPNLSYSSAQLGAYRLTMGQLFDKVTVIYEGRQVFFGNTAEGRAYFEESGFECELPWFLDPIFYVSLCLT